MEGQNQTVQFLAHFEKTYFKTSKIAQIKNFAQFGHIAIQLLLWLHFKILL